MKDTPLYYFIIDDDPDDQELMKDALKEIDENIECSSAYDGSEALQLLRSGSEPLPRLIFVDLNMPKMGGKEFLIQLKEDAQFWDIPVIIYSTSSESNEIRSLMDLGASWFLIKPNSFPELVAKLREIIKAPALKM